MFLLWIDDVREPPCEIWHWAKSVDEAKTHFIQLGGLQGKEGIVSLDHDAGDYAFMGGDYIKFLDWLDKKEHLGEADLSHISFNLHTMNTVGFLRMKNIIEHNSWRLLK